MVNSRFSFPPFLQPADPRQDLTSLRHAHSHVSLSANRMQAVFLKWIIDFMWNFTLCYWLWCTEQPIYINSACSSLRHDWKKMLDSISSGVGISNVWDSQIVESFSNWHLNSCEIFDSDAKRNFRCTSFYVRFCQDAMVLVIWVKELTSGGSRTSQRGLYLLFGQMFLKNAWKWRKLGQEVEGMRPNLLM